MLWLRFIFKDIPVKKASVLIAFFIIIAVTVAGVFVFRKHKTAGLVAAKSLLGILLIYAVNTYASTRLYYFFPHKWCMPWNPSTISYFLMPIVALLNIKYLKDAAYVLGFIAGFTMTFSMVIYPDMWVSFANPQSLYVPFFLIDADLQGAAEAWASMFQHAILFTAAIWIIASGDYKVETKNFHKFISVFLLLLLYAEVGNIWIVTGNNNFFLEFDVLPFDITPYYVLDYTLLFIVVVFCIYYVWPKLLDKTLAKRAGQQPIPLAYPYDAR